MVPTFTPTPPGQDDALEAVSPPDAASALRVQYCRQRLAHSLTQLHSMGESFMLRVDLEPCSVQKPLTTQELLVLYSGNNGFMLAIWFGVMSFSLVPLSLACSLRLFIYTHGAGLSAMSTVTYGG